MRLYKICLIPVVLCIVIVACDQQPRNPVAEYGDSMIDSYKKGQQAGVTANLDAVKKAVEAYRASHDRYPSSLDDIKDFIGSPMDLTQYDYNPANGSVSVKK
jgi:hypothetical protein